MGTGTMKKSEMIQILMKPFEIYNDAEISLTIEEANEILNRIEGAGMSPPFSLLQSQPFTDLNDKNGDWSSLNETRHWEPEEVFGLKIEVDPNLKPDEWYIKK
jgi:hypothetical protein